VTPAELAGFVVALAGLVVTVLVALLGVAVWLGVMRAKVESHEKRLDKQDSYHRELAKTATETRAKYESLHDGQ
jgi:hypothetical protein